VPTESELKFGDPENEIVSELASGGYDLVVLGAPLPPRHGHVQLKGITEGVMKNAGNCSILIVRSNYLGNR
jgi:nucleotide-binding universal stress UspA family protein